MTGHLLRGSRRSGSNLYSEGIARRNSPPTMNYVNADPECDFDYVTEGARKANIDVRNEQLTWFRRT